MYLLGFEGRVFSSFNHSITRLFSVVQVHNIIKPNRKNDIIFLFNFLLGLADKRIPLRSLSKEYQWNSLLLILLLCEFEVVFIQKLRKLSLFLLSDHEDTLGIYSDNTQLRIKVFSSHIGY